MAELAARDARAREAFLQIDKNGDGYVDTVRTSSLAAQGSAAGACAVVDAAQPGRAWLVPATFVLRALCARAVPLRLCGAGWAACTTFG